MSTNSPENAPQPADEAALIDLNPPNTKPETLLEVAEIDPRMQPGGKTSYTPA